MCLFSFVPFFVMLFSLPSETSACKNLDDIQYDVSSICPGSNNSKHFIEVDGRPVPFGSRHFRIQLEEPSKPAKIVCDDKFKTFQQEGNQVRVTYITHIVRIEVYQCETLEGPGPDIHCVVEAFSKACPGRPSDNHTCVYEVQTSYFSSSTVRQADEVKTEVALEVEQQAMLGGGVTRTEERIKVNVYSVNKRSYIVIPAGFRFCSYSEVHSVEYYLSPTGYKYSCKPPRFMQTGKITGHCSNLSFCESRSPCPLEDDELPFGSGKKSANPQPVTMLLVLSMVVCCNLANYIG